MKTNIPKSEGKKNHTLFFPVHTSTNMTYRHKSKICIDIKKILQKQDCP